VYREARERQADWHGGAVVPRMCFRDPNRYNPPRTHPYNSLCAADAAQRQGSAIMDDTQTVLDRHLAAFVAGDVEASIADYSDDAVFIGPGGASSGHDALRAMFTELYSELFKPGTYEFGLDGMQVEGPVVLMRWHADCAAASVTGAADTFVMRDGKIVAHTFTGQIAPK
jgi:ketosteroid isomerase-like protein